MRSLVSRPHLPNTLKVIGTETAEKVFIIVPDHDGGRPIEVNACILITHRV